MSILIIGLAVWFYCLVGFTISFFMLHTETYVIHSSCCSYYKKDLRFTLCECFFKEFKKNLYGVVAITWPVVVVGDAVKFVCVVLVRYLFRYLFRYLIVPPFKLLLRLVAK